MAGETTRSVATEAIASESGSRDRTSARKRGKSGLADWCGIAADRRASDAEIGGLSGRGHVPSAYIP